MLSCAHIQCALLPLLGCFCSYRRAGLGRAAMKRCYDTAETTSTPDDGNFEREAALQSSAGRRNCSGATQHLARLEPCTLPHGTDCFRETGNLSLECRDTRVRSSAGAVPSWHWLSETKHSSPETPAAPGGAICQRFDNVIRCIHCRHS